MLIEVLQQRLQRTDQEARQQIALLTARLKSAETHGAALSQERNRLHIQADEAMTAHASLLEEADQLRGECEMLRRSNAKLMSQISAFSGASYSGLEHNPIPSVGDDVHIPEDMLRPAQGPEAERTKETIDKMLHPEDDLITKQSREWLDGLKRKNAAQSQAEKQQDMRDDWWLRMPDQGVPSEPVTPVDHDLIKTDMQDMAGSIFGFIASFNQDAIDAGLPIFAGEIVCSIHDETMTVRIAKD